MQQVGAREQLEQLARQETGRLWNGVELRQLRELSAGNPLHARELIRAYPASGALAAARLPTGLAELFGAKAQALDPEHVDIVAAVALMRRPDLAELYAAFGDLPGERVGAADSFFALGGTSLVAMQMMVRLCREFDITLPLATIFTRPALGDLARAAEDRILADVGDPGAA